MLGEMMMSLQSTPAKFRVEAKTTHGIHGKQSVLVTPPPVAYHVQGPGMRDHESPRRYSHVSRTPTGAKYGAPN